MLVDRAKVGALNLFSDKPNVLDERSVDCALVLGAFATVAVRASIAAGMVGRAIEKPRQAKACAKVLIGALAGW